VIPSALDAAIRVPGAPVVVDVDQSDAFTHAHVPRARWLCRSRLEWSIDRVAPARARAVVVTSGDGVQATLAAATLADLGYDAAVLAGGTRAWQEAGLPVEHGTSGLGDTADDVVVKPYDRGRDAMIAYLTWEEALDDNGWSPIALLPDAAARPA
jgi:rhodanese-related sulfurtransferase